MKTYIRFENNKQVEVTTLDHKPEGIGWKVAPKGFDFSRRYKLSENGSVEEIPEEILNAERLEDEKANALLELSQLIGNRCAEYTGETQAKRKSYEIQEKAALAVLDNPDSVSSLLIKPLADIRGISVHDMAELIMEKVNLANHKIIKAEALEDQYQKIIKNALNSSELNASLNEVSKKLEKI